MSCRPIILRWFNCITETVQVTEGRMLASPVVWDTFTINCYHRWDIIMTACIAVRRNGYKFSFNTDLFHKHSKSCLSNNLRHLAVLQNTTLSFVLYILRLP